MREPLRRWGALAFLLAEGALYLAFLSCDLFRPQISTVGMKYAAILLCFGMALWGALRGGDPLVALALVLTVGADTFLLLLDRSYLAGVLLFYGVQLVYLMRLKRRLKGDASPLLRWGLLGAVLLLLWRMGALSPLNAVTALYISRFFCNLLQSRKWKGRSGRLFFWGLLLYFLCDLCVGLCNSAQPVPEELYRLTGVGMWFFYLPGQVLIVLSGLAPFGEECTNDQAE